MSTKVDVTRKDPLALSSDALVLFLARDAKSVAGLDADATASLLTALERRHFKGELGSTEVVDLDAGGKRHLVVACGVGKAGAIDVAGVQKAAASAARRVLALKAGNVVATLPPLEGKSAETIDAERLAWAVVTGMRLGWYRFDRYLTGSNNKTAPPKRLRLCAGEASAAARKGLAKAEALVEGAIVARDLVNEPAGALNPETYARAVRKLAKGTGLEVQVLSRKQIAELKMGALLQVAVGSDIEPKVVHLVLRPASGAKSKKRGRIALLGKGVTFDSGGYDLKSPGNMDTMKCDMAGSAAVVGAMLALARLEPECEIHGLVGLVENLVSGRAYKPGDVLKTRSGKTVEVMNTDAEGRLVLADLLDYACKELEPDAIVDLATLTGACVVALGPMATGVMTNHDALGELVLEAAEKAGERFWPLPLYDEYREMLKSPVADMKNIGGRYGGALTAGLFLKEFVDKSVPWVHLDIAGPAFLDKDHPFWGRGGTGAGVASLVEFVLTFDRGALSGEGQ